MSCRWQRLVRARGGGCGARGGLVIVQPCRTESWGAAKTLPGLGSRARYFCPGLVFPWTPGFLGFCVPKLLVE